MSKRKSPAFSFYPNDWFEGTMLLTVSQRGSYIDLLALSWVRGGFTKEQAYLAVRGSDPKDIDVVIAEKFVESESGWFTNTRLELEREKQGKRSSAASKNGQKGGRPKSQNKANGKAKDKAEPKLREKLSDLDLVSDSDITLSSALLAEIPDRFRSDEFDEVVLLWASKRSEGEGEHRKLIGLDPITLKTQLHKLGGVDSATIYKAVADAAGGGWKNLRIDHRASRAASNNGMSVGQLSMKERL